MLAHIIHVELAKFGLEAARGAQVRYRACWVEEGETFSAYFFRLEKKCGADHWISAIRQDDGTIVSSPADLCSSFAAFNTSLFLATPTDPAFRSALLGNVTSSLSPDMAALCEGPLTPTERLSALQGMEFYVKFWHVLGSDLVKVPISSKFLFSHLVLCFMQ